MRFIPRRFLTLMIAAVATALAAVAFWQNRGGAEPAAAAQDAPPVEMVVLMYHAIMSKESRAGDYIITPDAFEEDLKYISSHGFTTVVMKDIIAYVREGKPLPPNPIMITFDDGYYNNYLHAFPLLEQYQMKAVISIIGAETDKYSQTPEEKSESYTHLTWEMIQEMEESGLVEFQNHSYNLHKLTQQRRGAARAKGESDAAYQAMLREDLGRLQERFALMTGSEPTTFTYPFGAVSDASQEVVREMFQASLDAQGRNFILSRDPQCLWRIPRYNRPWGTPAAKIIEKALAGASSGSRGSSGSGQDGPPPEIGK